jgi:hypothetical protein
LKIAFTIKCRADDVEIALFTQLKELGLLRVYIGIESGCQRSLDLLNKGITVDGALGALRTLNELGIVADFYSLLFHPWSTLADIESELQFLEAALPYMSTCYSIRDVYAFPGTSVAARLQAEGRLVGLPWTYRYQIADPRVELLRRMSRLVFASLEVSGGFRDRLTQAWFALLQRQRFAPDGGTSVVDPGAPLAGADLGAPVVGVDLHVSPESWGEANALRSSATTMNRVIIAALKAMLEFASGPLYNDSTQVNRIVAEWAKRVNEISHL